MSERVDKAIFDHYPATHPVTLEYMMLKERIAQLEERIAEHRNTFFSENDRPSDGDLKLWKALVGT